MPRLIGKKLLVWVPITGGITLKYGFKMNETQFNGIGGELGIKAALGEPGVFFGANSPKPPRATKKTATGSQSSYYDNTKSQTLAKAGWKLTGASRIRAPKLDGLSITVAVDTPRGYMYAWNITKANKDQVVALGAEAVTAAQADLLVWGSFPKPPRATKIDGAGRTFSTFCPPTQQAVEAAVALGYAVEGIDGDWAN